MSQIKVVQIAIAGAGTIDGNEFQELYLDDKGRVWYQAGHYENTPTGTTQATGKFARKWVSEWKQMELPEEPDNG